LLTPALYTPPSKTKLQAFDEHVNMVLGDCEETHTSEETDGETGEVSLKSTTRQLGLIFVRGDIVVYVSPR
jgi:U6 snRNA-associated Sm-like protein LSm3